MKLVKTLYKYIFAAAVSLVALTSCGMMTEEEPDCNPYYKVRFRFDMNMLYADAFSSQVGEVDLYVFDTNGKLVWKGHEEGEALAKEGYLMDLPVAPGTYDFVAWCHNRHEDAVGFNLAGGDNPLSFEHLKMKMTRDYDGTQAHSTSDLHALFHGKLSKVELPDTWGTHVVTIPLTKDTNTIRITLVHLSGKEIKKGDFGIKIVDNNGHLDHDNTILDDEHVEYRPWAVNEGIANTVIPNTSNIGGNSITPIPEGTKAVSPIYSLTAEMTTSRLQTCQNPSLVITRSSDGEKVVEIPIIDYFMMVKGQYNRRMTDNEYLDRQDEYNMTFFMNEDSSWFANVIDILSWRVVRQATDL